MSFIAYVNMGDKAKGESLAKGFIDWIEATKCKHSVEQPKSPTRHTAGGTVNEAEHGDFQFDHYVDKSTPNLYKLVCDGTSLPELKIVICKSIGSTPTQYMEYKFTNVLVTKVELNIDGDYPKETVSFSYDGASWTYTQVAPDGTSKGNVAWSFERAAGVAA